MNTNQLQEIIEQIENSTPAEIRLITEIHSYTGTNYLTLPRALVLVHDTRETTHRGLSRADFVILCAKLLLLGYRIEGTTRDEFVSEQTWIFGGVPAVPPSDDVVPF